MMQHGCLLSQQMMSFAPKKSAAAQQESQENAE
jgi:hypothetical protein